MFRASKVLWGEGLFLRPQHFQQQDAFHECRLAERADSLHPYAWGIRKLLVDEDALRNGVLRIEQLKAIFPDGEIFSAPHEDPLPAPVSLHDIGPEIAEMTFHVALAQLRRSGTNFATDPDGADGSVRFLQKKQAISDLYTLAAEGEVSTLHRLVRALPDDAPRDHLVTLPACRIKRTATGRFELDTRFVPPCCSIDASHALQSTLRRVLDVLQAKVSALHGFHREPSRHVIEFRSGDIASFWLLHTSSSAFSALSHFQRHPGLHPERLFQQLLQLAGALMTFSKTFTLADLPSYHHLRPGEAFARLEAMLHALLETVISTRYFSIALRMHKASFYSGVLETDKITNQTTLVLAVKAALPPSELVSVVPIRLKAGAPDDVEKLVLSAMGGIRITHLPQVPAAIPVRPGIYYFELDARSPLYERMLQSQNVTIYAPAGLPELELELFALNN
jgi:type VI secretion system protein ImpJ